MCSRTFIETNSEELFPIKETKLFSSTHTILQGVQHTLMFPQEKSQLAHYT